MTNEQIKEKYGIEPVMKEGWYWDIDKTEAEKCLCLYKDSLGDYNFYCLSGPIRDEGYFRNFSETNPNSTEPKIGDWGWLWNDEKHGAYYGKLVNMYDNRLCAEGNFCFTNFSHEKPDFLK